MNHDHYPDKYIVDILKSVRTIALVGASPNSIRPSYIVMKYLIAKGYRIIPINPGHAGSYLLGQRIYSSLAEVPDRLDMIDVFRGSQWLMPIVDEILALDERPDVLWAQLTVRDDEAARRAEAAGMKVVMDRCPKIEYGRLSGEIGWNGVNSRVISSRRPKPATGYQALGIRALSQ